MSDKPTIEHVYEHFIMDSSRWRDFKPRDSDILVCTSYKAGTTWTQMICALLIHQTSDLPTSLAELSPWLDMRTASIDEVLEVFEAQTHRRFIKTHTALDGLPYYDNVTYIYCGRDPRDVFMSMEHHQTNMNMPHLAEVLGSQGIVLQPPPPAPEDINDRFKLWMTHASFAWEQDGLPFWSHFHHGETFWKHRQLPNVHFLHYADLKADLEGQMRRLAGLLAITVPEAKWPELVRAATFADMKANADKRAPDTNHGAWLSNSAFFNKGENEQWRGALSSESQQLYQDIARTRYDPIYIDWLERGSAATGDPKSR